MATTSSSTGQVSRWLQWTASLSWTAYKNTQHRALISAAGWKLIVSQEMRGELYDLNNDPFEETNLFNEPRSRPRIRDMMERLRIWQSENGDALDLSGAL